MKTESAWQTFTSGDPIPILEPNKQASCDDKFTFDLQRKKFIYIDEIGDYIEHNIQAFRDIWPLLGAYTKNESWHPRINEKLEFIGIAHYTVLKSLSYIIRHKDQVIPNDPDQQYKNVIFHYAVINDCVREICCNFMRFEKRLDRNLSKLIRENKSIEALTESRGRDSNIGLLNQEKYFVKFNVFNNNKIAPLRNAFIHNPSIDIFKKGHKILVVKPEYVRTHKTVQSINKLSFACLIEPDRLMNELFCEVIEVLSLAWDGFCREIKMINEHKNFENIKYNN